MSFRIYNNITPQIKKINIPFKTIVDANNQPDFKKFGTIPNNISILGLTAIVNKTLNTQGLIIYIYPISMSSEMTSYLTIEEGKTEACSYITPNVNLNQQSDVYIQAADAYPTYIISGTLTINYFQM